VLPQSQRMESGIGYKRSTTGGSSGAVRAGPHPVEEVKAGPQR
jgi:hypothetical protein